MLFCELTLWYRGILPAIDVLGDNVLIGVSTHVQNHFLSLSNLWCMIIRNIHYKFYTLRVAQSFQDLLGKTQ